VPNEFLGHGGLATLALRPGEDRASIGVGTALAAGCEPALETKTALNGTPGIRRSGLTVVQLLDATAGRRRSAHLTNGGLIGRRCVAPEGCQTPSSILSIPLRILAQPRDNQEPAAKDEVTHRIDPESNRMF
jgi:hypothetical protein